MSLYDRLFKPRRYTLPNGAVVEEKRSRAPLVILIVLVQLVQSLGEWIASRFDKRAPRNRGQ